MHTYLVLLVLVIFFHSKEQEPIVKVFTGGGDVASCQTAANRFKEVAEANPEVRDVEVTCIERKDKV